MFNVSVVITLQFSSHVEHCATRGCVCALELFIWTGSITKSERGFWWEFNKQEAPSPNAFCCWAWQSCEEGSFRKDLLHNLRVVQPRDTFCISYSPDEGSAVNLWSIMAFQKHWYIMAEVQKSSIWCTRNCGKYLMTVFKVYWLGKCGWPSEHLVPDVVQNTGKSSFRAYRYGERLVHSLGTSVPSRKCLTICRRFLTNILYPFSASSCMLQIHPI
jgi:hypothetical protein